VAQGLNYLHANYTVHGDLKGAGSLCMLLQAALTPFGQPNILIDHNGNARLTDFGLTSVVRRRNSVRVTGIKGYTTAWGAPEVLLEECDKATPEADIFSFGMVVIEVGPRCGVWRVRLTFKLRSRLLRGSTRLLATRR